MPGFFMGDVVAIGFWDRIWDLFMYFLMNFRIVCSTLPFLSSSL